MPHADKCTDIQNDEDADCQEEHERVLDDLVNDYLHRSAETEGQDCRIVEHGHDDMAPNAIEGWQKRVGNIGEYFSHDRVFWAVTNLHKESLQSDRVSGADTEVSGRSGSSRKGGIYKILHDAKVFNNAIHVAR